MLCDGSVYPRVKLYYREARDIFTRTRIPGAKYVINQYVGCQHACLYCYAKFMCRWKPYGRWGTWVEVKVNAAELAKGRLMNGKVYMSSVSDAYQPLEAKLRITRRILEGLDRRNRLSILTKSDLVLRDIDILREYQNVEVGLTVNGFRGEVKRVLEPYAPNHERRVRALRKMRDEGVKTYGFISPVLPGLVNVETVLEEIRDLIDYVIVEVINWRLAGTPFREYIAKRHPETYRTLTRQDKYEDYLSELKTILKNSKMKAELVLHRPKLVQLKLNYR